MNWMTEDQIKKTVARANRNGKGNNIVWDYDGGKFSFAMPTESANHQLGVWQNEKEPFIYLGMAGVSPDEKSVMVVWPGHTEPFPIENGNLINALKQAIDWVNSQPRLAKRVYDDIVDFNQSQPTDTDNGDADPESPASIARDVPDLDHLPSEANSTGPH